MDHDSFTFFPIYYSLMILSFHTLESEWLKASLNKLRIGTELLLKSLKMYCRTSNSCNDEASFIAI
jgi:hypothetical protein